MWNKVVFVLSWIEISAIVILSMWVGCHLINIIYKCSKLIDVVYDAQKIKRLTGKELAEFKAFVKEYLRNEQ